MLEKALCWVYWKDSNNNIHAMLIWMLREIFATEWAANLAMAVLLVVLWVGIAGWLNRRRIYFKV